jgi:hypothetical protein
MSLLPAATISSAIANDKTHLIALINLGVLFTSIYLSIEKIWERICAVIHSAFLANRSSERQENMEVGR